MHTSVDDHYNDLKTSIIRNKFTLGQTYKKEDEATQLL